MGNQARELLPWTSEHIPGKGPKIYRADDAAVCQFFDKAGNAFLDAEANAALVLRAVKNLTRPTPSERPVAQVREALELLSLEWRGWAQAIRLMDGKRETSDPAALRQAAAYEECGEKLRAALTSERSSESAVALANDCELYAKVHGSNIIVVANDWKPGDPERTEPRDTLLKAAAFIRAAAQAILVSERINNQKE